MCVPSTCFYAHYQFAFKIPQWKHQKLERSRNFECLHWDGKLDKNKMRQSATDVVNKLQRPWSMWLKCCSSFCFTGETKNGTRWKHLICVEWWDCNVPKMNTWKKHKCHISIPFFTVFHLVWGLTSDLWTLSSRCTLFLYDGLMAKERERWNG